MSVLPTSRWDDTVVVQGKPKPTLCLPVTAKAAHRTEDVSAPHPLPALPFVAWWWWSPLGNPTGRRRWGWAIRLGEEKRGGVADVGGMSQKEVVARGHYHE